MRQLIPILSIILFNYIFLWAIDNYSLYADLNNQNNALYIDDDELSSSENFNYQGIYFDFDGYAQFNSSERPFYKLIQKTKSFYDKLIPNNKLLFFLFIDLPPPARL